MSQRQAKAILVNYQWPGNVRELQNAIERAMVIGKKSMIVAEDLPLRVENSNQDRNGHDHRPWGGEPTPVQPRRRDQ